MKLWKKWWERLSAILSKGARFSALSILIIYRLVFSPLITALFGNVCRFEPSCSRYAIIAYKSHPPVRATWLTLRRVCKCHPLGPFGYDPVPERKMT